MFCPFRIVAVLQQHGRTGISQKILISRMAGRTHSRRQKVTFNSTAGKEETRLRLKPLKARAICPSGRAICPSGRIYGREPLQWVPQIISKSPGTTFQALRYKVIAINNLKCIVSLASFVCLFIGFDQPVMSPFGSFDHYLPCDPIDLGSPIQKDKVSDQTPLLFFCFGRRRSLLSGFLIVRLSSETQLGCTLGWVLWKNVTVGENSQGKD